MGVGAYGDESLTATYGEMLARGGTARRLGEPVILDTSWRHEAWRRLAREVADETASADVGEICCEAPPEVAVARFALIRLLAAICPTARRPAVAAMASDFDPWPTAAVVGTSGPPEAALRLALASAERDSALPSG